MPFQKWDQYIRGAESVSPERMEDQAVIAQVKAAVNLTNSVAPDQGAQDKYKAGGDGQAQ